MELQAKEHGSSEVPQTTSNHISKAHVSEPNRNGTQLFTYATSCKLKKFQLHFNTKVTQQNAIGSMNAKHKTIPK